MTTEEMEQYVRSKWKNASAKDTILWWRSLTVGYFKSWAEAWQAAYDFTLAREEEIRQVEEEIVNVKAQIDRAARDCIKTVYGECCTLSKGLEGSYAVCAIRFARILVREQAALANLKRGMK